MTRARVIDAHHHLWRLDRQEQPWRGEEHRAIARDFGPEELDTALASAGVEATVLVQSVDTAEENDRLAAYAAEVPPVAGVVAWLPLSDPDAAAAELDRISDMPALRGVRCLVGRDRLDWLAEPGVRDLLRELALRDLAWDVVPVTDEQVSAVVGAARAVPELRIVVDHLARPPLDSRGGGDARWCSRIRELAACPGVALKVSVGIDVLTSWEEWRTDALRCAVRHARECFGPGRLMLASNWPVVLLRRDYAGAWADLAEAAGDGQVSDGELAEMAGATAIRWYRLGA